MEARDRLKQVRAELGLSTRAVAEALGVGASVYSQWETGQAPVRKPNALAIQAIWGYRWEWLMNGEEPKRVGSAPRNAQAIPLLDGLPSCGPSGEIGDLGPHSEELVFSTSFVQEVLRQCGAGSVETLFAARVQGVSMQPLLEPGDTILVNTALPLRLEPRKGALHLVRKEAGSAEVRVKRVWADGQGLTLRSDNGAFREIYIELKGHPIQDLVVGRVCWYGRNLVGTPAPAPGDW